MKYPTLRATAVAGIVSLALPLAALAATAVGGTANAVTAAGIYGNTGVNANVNANITVQSTATSSSNSTAAVTDTGSGSVLNGTITIGTPQNVSSDADVQTYANTVTTADANVSGISTSDTDVKVTYKEPGKFLGFINTWVKVNATADASGKVTVSHPWYDFLVTASDDTSLQADAQTRAQSAVSASAQANGALSAQAKALLIQALHSALQAHVSATTNVSATTGAGY